MITSIILCVVSVLSCLATVGVYFRICRLTDKFKASSKYDDQNGQLRPFDFKEEDK